MSNVARHRTTGALLAVASVAGLLAGSVLASVSTGRSSSNTPAAAAVTATRGITYGGSTSSRDPIMLTLSRTGSRVTQLSTQTSAKCTSGKTLDFVVGPRASDALGPDGSFSGTRVRRVDLGGGDSALQTVTLKGKVTRLTLSGSATFHAEIVDVTHFVVDTCDRTVKFKAAAAKDRVFAGATSQRRPIVIELAGNRGSVHHFHIGWQASCRPFGGLSWGDTLVNFPLSRGRFGDTFSQKYSDPDGSSWVVRYRLRGGMSGPRAAGTFRWDMTGTDPTGAPVGCDTGSLSFRASSG